jgi:hypothetical protein
MAETTHKYYVPDAVDATAFPTPDCTAQEVGPGCCRIAEVEYTASRTIDDTAAPLIITSYTANPMPHVEYGRTGNN